MFHDGNNVGCVTSTCTFCVVSMDCPSFEGFNRLLYKSRLVERVCVYKGLDIVFFADTDSR